MKQGLAPQWVDTLDRLKRRRSSPILMPAAILVGLDLLGVGGASGDIPFSDFEERFNALVGRVDAAKVGAGWQPFYHLAGEASVWSLFKGSAPASFDDLAKRRPRSRAALVGRADRARMRPELLEAVSEEADRRALIQAVYALLESDERKDARSLVQEHKKSEV